MLRMHVFALTTSTGPRDSDDAGEVITQTVAERFSVPACQEEICRLLTACEAYTSVQRT